MRLEGIKKEFSIKRLSIVMLFISAGLFCLSICGIFNGYKNYKTLIGDTERYIEASECIKNFQRASDFLTEQARQYVVTGDSYYISKYFNELETDKNREKAIEGIKDSIKNASDDILLVLDSALEKSDELSEVEIHAIKLRVETINYEIKNLPEIVKNYNTENEANLGHTEKLLAAYKLVFDEHYSYIKSQIDDRTKIAADLIQSYLVAKRSKNLQSLRKAFITEIVFNFLIFSMAIAIFYIADNFVLKTIFLFVKNIREEKMLPEIHFKEFKYLASVYNTIFKLNSSARLKLRQQAERDSLTGLMNRRAYENVYNFLKDSADPVGLALVDVDKFKEINDVHGHKAGDDALVNVSFMLANIFGDNDYLIRFGGDEFAVVMVKTDETSRESIEQQINAVNEVLSNPVDKNKPKLSISVGVAFSEKGFSEELFAHADEALYHTKENGRCGVSFYQK